MTPVYFPQHNVVIAKDQPQYQPLPAFVQGDAEGTTVMCFELTEEEKREVLATGRIWLTKWTFNEPLQPISLSVLSPFTGQPERVFKDDHRSGMAPASIPV